jgi:hypothetical protein
MQIFILGIRRLLRFRALAFFVLAILADGVGGAADSETGACGLQQVAACKRKGRKDKESRESWKF